MASLPYTNTDFALFEGRNGRKGPDGQLIYPEFNATLIKGERGEPGYPGRPGQPGLEGEGPMGEA